MKVLLLNGSPRKSSCTYTALSIVARALNDNGIDTEIIHVGNPTAEILRETAAKLKEADGMVLGSPVYWASPTGQMVEFMDALSQIAGKDMKYKVGAAVVSARRAGTTAAIDVLNKYLTYHQMIIVSSNYWNMVHGNSPSEVMKDEEGKQILRILGNNMAYVLKCLEAGRKAGVREPEEEKKIMTNFIR